MSQVDLSEDEAVVGDRLVPVSEAIRYRKRAQSAEKHAAELEDELRVVSGEKEKLVGELGGVRIERDLVSRLTQAGAVDVEGAMIIAKSKLGGELDADAVVSELVKEKGYLFREAERVEAAGVTAVVREKGSMSRSLLERSAKKAAMSGSRTDVQEYLKVRRQFVK
jgi:hypothetical protein